MLCYVMLYYVKEKTMKDMLLKINGTSIEQVKYTKFLGIYIDDELTRKCHINQFTSKTSKMTGIIDRARHYLSRQSV